MPGTTRDTVDALLRWHRRTFRIVDTAGIRRPGGSRDRASSKRVSVVLARRAIEKADVAVLVIDASEGATDQDAAIAGEAEKAGCGIIIAANKWDLMKGRGADFSKTFDEELRRQVKFLDYAPVLHISATTGERTGKVLETIDKVAEARMQAGPDGRAEPLLQAVTAAHPPGQPGQAGTCGFSTPRRPASRRRPSCSSRTSRPSFTSRTSGSWPIGCANRSG